LPNDLIKLGRAHSGLLQLLEWAACFDSLMLASVADQEYTVVAAETRKKLAHLVGAGEAGFIKEVEVPLVLSGGVCGASKEPLQGSGLDAGLAKLPCSAGGRGEALDRVTVRFGGTANDGKCRRFARPSVSLDALNSVWRAEHIFNYSHLGAVEMRMLVGKSDGLLARQNRLNLALPLADTADDFVLCFDGLGGGELARR
jgi:hypothetical protein